MITPKIVKPYMLQNFPDGTIVSDGKEYNMNSPLVEDTGKKFWMNIRNGQWQCFASSKYGNFAKFVSLTTGRKYSEVEAELLFKTFLDPPVDYSKEEELPPPRFIPKDILDTFEEIDPIGDSLHQRSIKYLLSRKLYSKDNKIHNNFFVCTEGLYRDRLIIPYFLNNILGKDMFYFQGRSLNQETHPKYLNYKGVKSSRVLYPYDDESTNPLYITEGAFDARVLQLCGLNATSTLSCSVSNVQLDYLKEYEGELVIAYDGDKPGLKGLQRFNTLRKHKCMNTPKYVFPPIQFNDWNEAWQKNFDLVPFIEDNTKEVSFLIDL